MKIIFRAVLFSFVFILGVILFSEMIKEKETEPAVEMTEATLPVVCIDLDGNKADRLYGYKEEMDPMLLREAIIPLTNERTISLSYKANGNEIRAVSYEITTPDTGEVVANATVGNFLEDGDYMTASFTLNGAILMNREYPIRFTLETAEGDISYYARLLQRSTDLASEYVDFVYGFYESCLSKSTTSGISTYLETSSDASGSDFTEVSLKSTFDQVTWGNLSPTILRKAVPTITEINNTTCSLTNSYLLGAVNEDGENETYEVTEFYRLRYGTDRMRVLNFTRTARQVFDPEGLSSFSTSGISLGASDPDVEFEADETDTIVAFVRDRTLWCYNSSSKKLTKVFGFRSDADNTDERYDHADHEIHIIRVTNTGDIDFYVDGYMNRGTYEGRCGLLLASYRADNGRVEERAFIDRKCSYELLSEDLSHLCYMTEDGIGYAYLDQSVIRIDTEEKTISTLLDEIDPDCFKASTDNSRMAWMDQMSEDTSESITIMDLETGEESSIEASAGTYIRALGFINNDFIYGEAPSDELLGGTDGKTVFPISRLTIRDKEGQTVMTYEKTGVRIIGVTITGPLIELKRCEIGEDRTLKELQSDTIMNNDREETTGITIKTATDKRRGRLVSLVMPSTIRNLNPLVQTARFESGASSPVEDVTPSYAGPAYNVYAGGHLYARTDDASEAVTEADENVGIALDAAGRYLYERGNTSTENEIAAENIPEAMLLGTMETEKLEAALGEGEELVDLKGCTLEEVLYQVSCGRPVLARSADGSTSLIVGYNKYNTRRYDYTTGEYVWVGINDSTEEFAKGGNVFLTIMTDEATRKENE